MCIGGIRIYLHWFELRDGCGVLWASTLVWLSDSVTAQIVCLGAQIVVLGNLVERLGVVSCFDGRSGEAAGWSSYKPLNMQAFGDLGLAFFAVTFVRQIPGLLSGSECLIS